MSQSKKGSLLEAFINVAIGYGVAVASQIVIFPLFGVHISVAENMTDLKCYFLSSKTPSDFCTNAVVFARSKVFAKFLGFRECNSLFNDCGGDRKNVVAVRKPEFDRLCFLKVPYLVTDNKTLRDVGFGFESDDFCTSCGKASMQDNYPLDETTLLCEDCLVLAAHYKVAP